MSFVQEILEKKLVAEKLELLMLAHEEHKNHIRHEVKHLERKIAKAYRMLEKFREERNIISAEIAAHHEVSPKLLEHIAILREKIHFHKEMLALSIAKVKLIHHHIEKVKHIKEIEAILEIL